MSIVEMAMLMEIGMNIMKLPMAFNTHNDKIRLMQQSARAGQMCCEKFRISNFPVATCGAVLTSMVKTGFMIGVSFFVCGHSYVNKKTYFRYLNCIFTDKCTLHWYLFCEW